MGGACAKMDVATGVARMASVVSGSASMAVMTVENACVPAIAPLPNPIPNVMNLAHAFLKIIVKMAIE